MPPFLAELLGTMLLIVLGDGVVANVVLNKTKGQNAGWIVITAGWGFGVAVAVYAVGAFSGAHLNPAVTIGLASIGKFPWASVPGYIAAQMLGALLGATIVWLAYLPHWPVTESQAGKLGVFCTGPAIRKTPANLLTEIIGTAVLVPSSAAPPLTKASGKLRRVKGLEKADLYRINPQLGCYPAELEFVFPFAQTIADREAPEASVKACVKKLKAMGYAKVMVAGPRRKPVSEGSARRPA